MQVCPHCGRESRDIDRYCLHCGQRMDSSGGSDALPSYSAIPGPARGAATPVLGGDDVRGPLGKRAVAAGTKNPPPAMRPRTSAIARLVLKARAGEQSSPREYPLDGSDIVIGRAPSCDIVLPNDQLASRRHSLLEYDGVRYTVRDLGSSNGTYVNGEEIRQTIVLNDGDNITVGEHELVFSRIPARNTDGFPIPVPPPWPPAFTGTAIGQPAGPTEKHSAVSSVRHQMPPNMPDAAHAAHTATGAPALGGEGGDIEQLHKLLVDASAGMLRRAEEAEREVVELRALLAEMELQIGGALGVMAGESQPGDAAAVEPEVALAAERRLDELVRLARAAADNPRHLDHISALAERAGDISDTLEAARELARGQGAMSARLAELAAEPDTEPE
jgi:pSer/pThr/pTyr-binding forkhead associated (FHA) protein